MGEISYTNKQRSEPSFAVTKATHLDIQFSPSEDHLTFRLKRSKTDKDKQGVQIIIAATFNAVCPVAALQRLFLLDPRLPPHRYLPHLVVRYSLPYMRGRCSN